MRRRRGLLGGPKASGLQILGGALANMANGEAEKQFNAKGDSPYAAPLVVAVVGHFAKRFNPNVGAGICGGAGVLAHQAYKREEAKKSGQAQGMYEPNAAGMYEPVSPQ